MARDLGRVVGRALMGAALLAFVWAAPAVQAADQAKVLISFDKPEALSDIGTEVSVRPNTLQAIYVAVENRSGDPQKMTVLLRAKAEGAAKYQDVASADLGAVKDKDKKLVTQWKVLLTPPAPPAVPPTPLSLDYLGPRFQLQIEVLGTEVQPAGAKPANAAEAKSLTKPAVDVRVMAPTEYIEVAPIKYVSKTADKSNRLSVTVTATKSFLGPKCEVALDLRPNHIPGLIASAKTGAYKQFLTKAGESVELFAENIAFKGEPPAKGWVYITVDGYERAFRFATDFTKEQATPELDKTPALRLELPGRYLLPAEKVRAALEVDGYPKNLTLKVGIDRNNNGQLDPDELIEKRGARATSLHLALAPEGGAVQLRTDVKPWEIDLPAAGLLGEFNVMVWGNYIDDKDGTEKTLFPGGSPEKSVKVIFDDRPPDKVKFALPDFPIVVAPGKPLPVIATATTGKVPLTKAIFFLGKLTPDKKLPADAVQVEVVPAPDKEGVWLAKGELTLPPDLKSPSPLSVQFTNALGLSEVATVSLVWVPPPPIKPIIAGTVLEGGLLQPGLEVGLFAVNGTLLTKVNMVNTSAKGAYVFEDVKPGKYVVYSAKSGGSRGQVEVQLDPGQKKEGVVVNLTR